jgi:hydroxyacylglutathione hydrolase
MLMVKGFEVGMLATNCYVINCKDTMHAAVIDPGFDSQQEADEIIGYIRGSGLEVKFIVDTHGHPDHTSGNAAIKDAFQAPICIHQDDAYMLGESGKETARYFGYNTLSPPADILLQDGQYLNLGDVTLKVLHTPGHSFGSISVIGETEIFTGDALFAGSIGRTDFPASSDIEMQRTLKKLKQIPDYFTIYPGHGPQSTIAEQKRVNPFLQNI